MEKKEYKKKSQDNFLLKKNKNSLKEKEGNEKGHLPFILSHNDGVW